MNHELLMKLALIGVLCCLVVLVSLQQNATMLVAYRYNDCSKTLQHYKHNATNIRIYIHIYIETKNLEGFYVSEERKEKYERRIKKFLVGERGEH